jgi:hypothetical protein
MFTVTFTNYSEPQGFAGGVEGGGDGGRWLGKDSQGGIGILETVASKSHGDEATPGNPACGEGLL